MPEEALRQPPITRTNPRLSYQARPVQIAHVTDFGRLVLEDVVQGHVLVASAAV